MKYAQAMGLDWKEAFTRMCMELPFKRLRLMTYWDTVEPTRGHYDLKVITWQLKTAAKYRKHVSLCLGMRQPRWPECHEPAWAKKLSQTERHKALYKLLEKIVEQYKDDPTIESWQLENEALNRGIGECTDYDRARLRHEFELVKRLDPKRPIIMSTSDSFGLPLRRPRPDIVGVSIYKTQWRNGRYYQSWTPAIWYRLRAWLVRALVRRPVIIHELQTEPWGPKATAQLSLKEQNRSMNAEKLEQMLRYAQKTRIDHVDLWGVEWWYWLGSKHNDWSCWQVVVKL